MVSTNTSFDLYELYQNYFGNKPYHINKPTEKTAETGYNTISQNPNPKGTIFKTKDGVALNKIGIYGKDIWFPVTLWLSDNEVLEIEACTVGVNLTSTIIRTPVNERKGTVKESFFEDDYKFTIKGFVIGKNRQFPEDEILFLKKYKESQEPKQLRGGYVELFLTDHCGVVVTGLDFPEVQGKAPWIRPFTMTLESDFILSLINEIETISKLRL